MRLLFVVCFLALAGVMGVDAGVIRAAGRYSVEGVKRTAVATGHGARRLYRFIY